jgi:hypothetical protein
MRRRAAVNLAAFASAFGLLVAAICCAQKFEKSVPVDAVR